MNPGRYDVSGLIEAQYEPGSRGRVLRNLLGIRRTGDMELAESQALELAQRQAIEAYSQDHRFTATDVCRLHAIWLGPIYAWAGEYRAVNITKDGFPFAAAARDYRVLIGVFRKVIDRTWRNASSSGR